MEIHRGLVGGGEEGGGDVLAAESADHRARVEGAVADLKEVVVGLGGEVEELEVGSWGERKEKICFNSTIQHYGVYNLKVPECLEML